MDNALIDTLPAFLVSQGHNVCTMEYRRSVGFPGTNEDCLSALVALHNHKEEARYSFTDFQKSLLDLWIHSLLKFSWESTLQTLSFSAIQQVYLHVLSFTISLPVFLPLSHTHSLSLSLLQHLILGLWKWKWKCRGYVGSVVVLCHGSVSSAVHVAVVRGCGARGRLGRRASKEVNA